MPISLQSYPESGFYGVNTETPLLFSAHHSNKDYWTKFANPSKTKIYKTA